ncbi:MAG: sugar ABC transporter permease [Spirochaetae bacterium HGW-Spirochaetae-7]|jgi:multiple sugar transport system permease protein|nr:MAG: sugar ABC transporter permease [Spirochaetae bacterium HGW-Spirochaetae-7]
MVRTGFVEKNLRILFPLPAIAFVMVMMIFPIAYTAFLSFTNWNLTSGQPLNLVGLRSYARVLREPRVLDAIGRTFLFTGGAVFVEAILGTTVALVLHREFFGKGLMKLLLLLPLVATPVAIGIVWNLFYDPTIGLANYALSILGIPKLAWVSDARTVIAALVVVDVWQWTPMISLIVLAGLAGLSSEPYEAARVDGATERQILWNITLPMVMPTILTAMILRTVDALKTFDIIFAMTGGGPGYSSETLNVLGFKYSFEYFKMGQASVILVFLFAIVLLCSILIMKVRDRTQV